MNRLYWLFSIYIMFSTQCLSAKSNVQTTIALLSEEIVALRAQLNNLKQDTNLKLHRYEIEIESLKAETRKLNEQHKQNSKEFITAAVSETFNEKLSKITDTLTATINHKIDKQNTKFDQVLEKVDNFISAQDKVNKAFKQEKLDAITSKDVA